ncbi:MAG: hypothetical protein GEU86_20185, partial [Actinophytocola sp.]|nr:hypothetical protein [Actinophytocola sp.]
MTGVPNLLLIMEGSRVFADTRGVDIKVSVRAGSIEHVIDPISPAVSGAEWWRQDKTELVAALRERESGMRRLQAETY